MVTETVRKRMKRKDLRTFLSGKSEFCAERHPDPKHGNAHPRYFAQRVRKWLKIRELSFCEGQKSAQECANKGDRRIAPERIIRNEKALRRKEIEGGLASKSHKDL